MIDPAIDMANRDTRLTGLDRRVLGVCHRHLNAYQPRQLKRATVKRDLGWRGSGASKVTRSLRKLIEAGYLVRCPDDGRLRTYILSLPHVEGSR